MPRVSFDWILWLVAGVAVALTLKYYFGAAMGQPNPIGGPAAFVGTPATSFPIATLNGSTDSLDRYRGKVVVVNLFASWCAPCRSETPALEELYQENRVLGLAVVGIDQGESAGAAGAFARELGVSYPIWLDEDQRYGRSYIAVGLPTTLIVDRTGRIARGIDGPMTLPQMRAAIAPAMAAKAL